MLRSRSIPFICKRGERVLNTCSNRQFGTVFSARSSNKVKGGLTREQILGLPSIPSWSPSYPLGPYYFKNREYFIVEYEADMADIKKVVPEPLEPKSNRVLYEWIAMPDSSGFGSYQESGTVIPCIYNGKEINYTAQMFLDDEPPIACGREIWGFPKKYGSPTLKIERDTLVGVLEYAGQQVAMGSMTYKHNSLDKEKVAESLSKTSCNLRLIPKPDGTGLERAQLVEYNLTDIEVIEASSGNARLALFPLVTAPAADIPVKKIIGGKHIRANLVLPHGRVLYDYLKDEEYITKQSSIDNGYMTKEKVLDCPSMPAIAPSYPHQDTTTIDRSIMYIHCRSDIDFLRTLIPYPVDLDSANPDIFFSISHTLGTGIGEYSSFKVLIPCEINGIRCMFNALNVTDNSSPITCGRERLGQPQKYGQPKLEVRKDTIVGTLTYGSQTISVSSMVFNAKKLSKQQTKDLMQLPELNLRVLPNVTGEVDIAQLVLMRYGNKQISEGWQGSARIHNIPHVNAPLADVPIKETVCGYHIKVSHEILAHAEILYDFKLASS